MNSSPVPSAKTARTFDVVVIGGGSAGYAAARTATAAGARTAVVEDIGRLGGLCILRGCMPTKALLESAHRWQEIGRAAEFGLKVKALAPDLPAIFRRKEMLIADFAGHRAGQLRRGDFTLIRGRARFLDPQRIEVRGRGPARIVRAKTFIVATGSEIHPVSLPGLEEAGCLTSDSALAQARLPRSLVVLGGGAIAVEFAQFYAALGTKVTLLQRNAHLVKEFDSEVSAELEAAFRDEGVTIRTGVTLERVRRRGARKEVVFTQDGKRQTVAAEEIFYALGRRPRLGGLDLPLAGVPIRDGRIAVDTALRTRAPHIFAAGDVAGPYEVVHLAVQQGEITARNAVAAARGKKGKPETIDYRLKTSIVFTQPEVASVGLTEREARAKGAAVFAAQYRFDDHGKSMIMGAKHGFVKLVADLRGKILGAQIIGPHASDLIHELIAVMYYRGTVQQLAAMPHYHPTLAEIVTYPAEEIADRIAAGKRKRKSRPRRAEFSPGG